MERLDAFMARANAAYYARRDPFADFTTAPEISQVFGEILGLWAAVVWQSMGAPRPVLLAEAGPGRGTLMADARRAIAQAAPGFGAAAAIHLIETSPRLRELQARAVPGAGLHAEIGTLPAAPMLLIANEFLDALPIRQFVRRGGTVCERFVDSSRYVEKRSECSDEGGTKRGEIVELGEAAAAFAAAAAGRVTRDGGAALLIDYGYEHGGGESLQALRDGRPADPLADPGEADLTAHVNFAAIAAAARAAGAAVHGPVPQGLFLARLGLFQRTDRLARTQPPQRAAALIEAARRLAEPDRMGRMFKAMAICNPRLPCPPGFAA
jgi:SAM-dependent MidA family methyltransferase